MPDPLHICLGANGDICLILPALKAWADEHGKPARLMVAKDYAGILDGCSYVHPVIWEGEWHDLWAAQCFLKTDLPEVPVKVLQFYQKGDDKVLPSFAHEMRYLAGLLDGRDHPLVFDQRDPFREQMLVDELDDGRPMILVAVKGRSSPMEKGAEIFFDICNAMRPDCNVIDLSEVQCERIYDLLGLYDHAVALVSIDTVHLHLSRASNVPVFALARDYPETWHGTPWDERFKFYCRYGEYEARKGELIDAIKGMVQPKPRLLFGFPTGSYNPSIIVHEGETLISARHHPDRTWKTQLTINGLPVKFPHPVQTYAHEDMRLFHFNGKLMASYVCARGDMTDPRCIQGYGELVKWKDAWYIKEHFQPEVAGNDWSGMQKNMICFEHDGKIHAIWDFRTIIQLNGSKEEKSFWKNKAAYSETPGSQWRYGEIRGGTSPLSYQGKWLRFFHSRIWPDGKMWRYHVGALLMEPDPPFDVVKVSSKPIISGDESGDPMIWHYKPNCVLPFGAVEEGDGWLVSLGVNDSACAVLHVKPEELNL